MNFKIGRQRKYEFHEFVIQEGKLTSTPCAMLFLSANRSNSSRPMIVVLKNKNIIQLCDNRLIANAFPLPSLQSTDEIFIDIRMMDDTFHIL